MTRGGCHYVAAGGPKIDARNGEGQSGKPTDVLPSMQREIAQSLGEMILG
jgi:hypothetical protein